MESQRLQIGKEIPRKKNKLGGFLKKKSAVHNSIIYNSQDMETT